MREGFHHRHRLPWYDIWVIYRHGLASDAEQYAAVRIAAWTQAYQPFFEPGYLESLDPQVIASTWPGTVEKLHAVVAMDETTDRMAGYALLGLSGFEGCQHLQEVKALYVHPDYQAAGVGRGLMARMVRATLKMGEQTLIIGAFRDNTRARAVYEGWGAREIGQSTFAVGGIAYPDVVYRFDRLRELRDRLVKVTIRDFCDTDDVQALTELLHRAYSDHKTENRRFLATYQDASVTKDRLTDGKGFIVEFEGRVVGTATVYFPEALPHGDYHPTGPIATFGQYGVDPDVQGFGIGTKLLAHLEDVARALGATELALDTAETATELIGYYHRLGFRVVGAADWRPTTNYLSVIMSKDL